jgi:hypothetical protein
LGGAVNHVYNTVVYNCPGNGIRFDFSNANSIYDSVIFNCGTDVNINSKSYVMDYCAHDDADYGASETNMVDEGTTGGAAWPNIFTDAANGDFTLKVGCALIGAGGKAGSALFSDDIEGTTRGAAWDLGPYEYVAPPATGYINETCVIFES